MAEAITIKFDEKKFEGLTRQMRTNLMKALKRNFTKAGLEFISHIQEKWYSGRHADDTGLNRITGALWKSFLPKTSGTVASGEITTQIISNVEYGKYHEKSYEPAGGGPRRNPPRTDVAGDFVDEKIGVEMFAEAIEEAFKEVEKK